MAKKETIQFIMTGGTIDSYWDGARDTARPLKHSVVPDFINSLKLYEKTAFTEICMKDSRDLTKNDLRKILDTIQKAPPCNKIIITHGTYSMPDTARYLKANLERNDQVIVLTGSMIPISGFAPSDGTFNLGFAIAKVMELPAGIYVCMNGKTFTPEEVAKVICQGRFTSIFEKTE